MRWERGLCRSGKGPGIRQMRLEQTWEYQQSMRMRPACDRVLCEVFGVEKSAIHRFEKEDGPHILDQEFAIDLKVLLPNGGQVSGQEKALSFGCYKFRTFTIEFWQNRFTKEPGEWFRIASQFYLSGYSDESGIEFIEWHIIRMMQFLTWLKSAKIAALDKRCRPSGGSRAAFLPVPYESIPRACIYAMGSGPGRTEINFGLDALRSSS